MYCNVVMKLQMETLHNSKKPERGRRGKGWDLVLFRLFRDDSTKPEVKRVEKVLSLMVAAQTHLIEMHTYLRSGDDLGSVSKFLSLHRRHKESERAYYMALKQLQTALKRYRWRSSIKGDLDGFGEELEWDDATTSGGHANWEYAAVRLLLNKTREPGTLSRFRKCSECHEWFYAATSHQHFCKDGCRRRNASRDPEFKAKRRIYMREQYRPQQKELHQRSLALAKGTKLKKGKV